jgi:hypothetical protein
MRLMELSMSRHCSQLAVTAVSQLGHNPRAEFLVMASLAAIDHG